MAAKPTYEALENLIAELKERNAELSRLMENRLE